MKTLHYLVLIVLLSLSQGFMFKSKKKDNCPKYDAYQKNAIACLLQHEGAFESKDIKTRCRAYSGAARCMRPLLEVNKKCGLSAPVDVYHSYTTWEYLDKTRACG